MQNKRKAKSPIETVDSNSLDIMARVSIKAKIKKTVKRKSISEKIEEEELISYSTVKEELKRNKCNFLQYKDHSDITIGRKYYDKIIFIPKKNKDSQMKPRKYFVNEKTKEAKQVTKQVTVKRDKNNLDEKSSNLPIPLTDIISIASLSKHAKKKKKDHPKLQSDEKFSDILVPVPVKDVKENKNNVFQLHEETMGSDDLPFSIPDQTPMSPLSKDEEDLFRVNSSMTPSQLPLSLSRSNIGVDFLMTPSLPSSNGEDQQAEAIYITPPPPSPILNIPPSSSLLPFESFSPLQPTTSNEEKNKSLSSQALPTDHIPPSAPSISSDPLLHLDKKDSLFKYLIDEDSSQPRPWPTGELKFIDGKANMKDQKGMDEGTFPVRLVMQNGFIIGEAISPEEHEKREKRFNHSQKVVEYTEIEDEVRKKERLAKKARIKARLQEKESKFPEILYIQINNEQVCLKRHSLIQRQGGRPYCFVDCPDILISPQECLYKPSFYRSKYKYIIKNDKAYQVRRLTPKEKKLKEKKLKKRRCKNTFIPESLNGYPVIQSELKGTPTPKLTTSLSVTYPSSSTSLPCQIAAQSSTAVRSTPPVSLPATSPLIAQSLFSRPLGQTACSPVVASSTSLVAPPSKVSPLMIDGFPSDLCVNFLRIDPKDSLSKVFIKEGSSECFTWPSGDLELIDEKAIICNAAGEKREINVRLVQENNMVIGEAITVLELGNRISRGEVVVKHIPVTETDVNLTSEEEGVKSPTLKMS